MERSYWLFRVALFSSRTAPRSHPFTDTTPAKKLLEAFFFLFFFCVFVDYSFKMCAHLLQEKGFACPEKTATQGRLQHSNFSQLLQLQKGNARKEKKQDKELEEVSNGRGHMIKINSKSHEPKVT